MSDKTNPNPKAGKNPDKGADAGKDGETKKFADVISGFASTLTEFAKGVGDGEPDEESVAKFAGIVSELHEVLSPAEASAETPDTEPTTKVVEMDAEQFGEHLKKQLVAAMGDAEKLEKVKTEIEALAKQIADGAQVFKVTVHRDAEQLQTTEEETQVKTAATPATSGTPMGAFQKQLDALTKAVTDLSATVAKQAEAAGDDDAGGDDDADKAGVDKAADDVAWPLDLNKLRENKTEAETWGHTDMNKSAGDDALNFGADPAGL